MGSSSQQSAISGPRAPLNNQQRAGGVEIVGVLLWCLLLLAGCSPFSPFTDAYPGPFRSPNEVAIVSGRAQLIGQPGYQDVSINSIDGERAIGGWRAPSEEVQILPGSHSIGVVEAGAIESAGSGEVFKDQAILRFKVIVGARYALGYNPTTKEFMVVRVGLGPVPFELVK